VRSRAWARTHVALVPAGPDEGGSSRGRRAAVFFTGRPATGTTL